MKKNLAIMLLCLCTAGTIYGINKNTTVNEEETISIIGVGDIMMGTNYPSANYLPPNDGKDLLGPVKAILKDANITFGNLEGTLLDKGGDVKHCKDPAKCYAFRSPERYAMHLLAAGFDMVSLANNHSGDFGLSGREKTMATLDNLNIKYAGLLVHPTTIVTKDSIKYGLAAFAPNSGTCDIRNIAAAAEIVKELDKEADIIIVSFHGGAEGSRYQHVTKTTEKYLGENRGNVYKFAHAMIDAGADVIFGHGPHVTRAVDLYKDRFIAYSLGNFCTYARFNLSGVSGLAPIVKVNMKKDGTFIDAKITPTIQKGEGGPEIDPDKKVIGVMQSLTKADFPNGLLVIEDDGAIHKKAN